MSKKIDFQIHPYYSGDCSAMLILARAALGYTDATPMSPAFWQWKHHRSPFGDSYGVYAWDECKSTAAGMRILMRWQFDTIQRQHMRGARAVDTATHPNYQRQGLFSTLTRRAIADLTQEGIDFIYNTPNQKSLPGYLKLGWQVVAQWPLYIKILRPWRMLLRRIRPQANSDIGDFTSYFKPPIVNWSLFIQTYGEQLPNLIAQWETGRRKMGVRTRRGLAYFDWRYGQHPTIQYGVYAETAPNGQLTGFAILRPNLRYRCQEVVLTELCLAQPTIDCGIHLLRNLARQVRADYLIAHFAEGTVERQMLRRSGFFRIPRQGMVFTVRPLQPGLETFCQPDQWDLTLGDLEIF